MKLQDARLLLVTDPRPDLADRVTAAVRGGVDVVQLRDKQAGREELLPLAEELEEICDRGNVIFTVNDDPDLARSCGADGVHLGQEDEDIESAREKLGPDALIGLSAGGVEEARRAVEAGADYLGVGTVFATPTKENAEVAGLTLVEEVAQENLSIPWFAIGGIDLEKAGQVVDAGAPGVAVVRAILDAEDPEAAARELRSILP